MTELAIKAVTIRWLIWTEDSVNKVPADSVMDFKLRIYTRYNISATLVLCGTSSVPMIESIMIQAFLSAAIGQRPRNYLLCCCLRHRPKTKELLALLLLSAAIGQRQKELLELLLLFLLFLFTFWFYSSFKKIEEILAGAGFDPLSSHSWVQYSTNRDLDI